LIFEIFYFSSSFYFILFQSLLTHSQKKRKTK